ncbi:MULTISPECIES: hypothetical protein [Pseudothermotoga]|jgi:hypothetical protein|uniref:Uncharacterized protein n=1 Tax=Pseudothermotoga lettingae (strain ATCC BAA-301 / DSM 14385 / NBRC 107922 / TMO) TaxID=416591 RepID=A8F7N7_PSELT|nr:MULTISPECIES: hypothetical protein [Pseudothermotoga]ABV34171.1 hypothetical protein Tlet_1617 [Pseudothermotoga lettingae TMO]MDK2884777.1 hypothetical protein [Pseudothermotoga sp.]GLI48885.1 hypothetical protein PLETTINGATMO_10540 [Pseudothermotoga lettingae TMO]
MKKVALLVLIFLCAAGFAANYGVYYDQTIGKSTAIFVSNLSEEKAYFRVVVYDYKGNTIWQNSYRSNEFETVWVDLSQVIPQSDENWGLVLIQSDQLLYISALYKSDDVLVGRDHVIEPVQVSSDAKYYWYGLNYTNFVESQTAFSIMNTSDREADVIIDIYSYEGDFLDELSGTISPRAAAYINLSEEIQTGSMGVIDIRSTELLILGVEYYDKGGLWGIENIVDWYTTTSW